VSDLTEFRAPAVQLLAIGVNRVPGVETLRWAEKDAASVSILLHSARGPCAGNPAKAVLLGKRATGDAVAAALVAAARARPDVFVFYFSGHGNSRGLALADQTLPFDLLERYVRACRIPRVLVVLDSCGSGALVDRLRKGAEISGIEDGIQAWSRAIAHASRGARVITAVAADRKAHEDDIGEGGYFTLAFLDALRASNGDLILGDHSFVSDARALLDTEDRLAVLGLETPMRYGTTDDLPLCLSEFDAPIGTVDARWVSYERWSYSARLEVIIRGRRFLPTCIRCALVNESGRAIDRKAWRTFPMSANWARGAALHASAGGIARDKATRIAWAFGRSVKLRWVAEVRDAYDRVLAFAELPVWCPPQRLAA